MSEHPKDICTCGHTRGEHRLDNGACRHKHIGENFCARFELAEAHFVLGKEAHSLLYDLDGTSEPVASHKEATILELYACGFLAYTKDGTWIGITPAGAKYIRSNGAPT